MLSVKKWDWVEHTVRPLQISIAEIIKFKPNNSKVIYLSKFMSGIFFTYLNHGNRARTFGCGTVRRKKKMLVSVMLGYIRLG